MEKGEKIIEVENISKEEILKENEYLKAENRKLIEENEKIRDIFRIAVVEFERKDRRIELLEREVRETHIRIKELEEENCLLKRKIEEYEGRVKLLNKMIFGRRNEKGEKPEKIKKEKRGREKGHKGIGRNIPKNLPIEEEIIELPEEERYCSVCGAPLEEIGSDEVSREVVIRKEYVLKVIKRKKYKKTCGCEQPIITAPLPPKLIPKSKFSFSFWVDVLINKFKNHLPIERQISDMAEYGLDVKSGTIFKGLKILYFKYIRCIYEALIENIRGNNHFYSDETGWKLFTKVDEKGNYNWFVWVFISKDIVIFVLSKSRSAKVPLKTLFDIEPEEMEVLEGNKGVNKKRVSVDKFSAYKVLERTGFVELSYCWAHQRREFIELKIKYPEIKQWCEERIEKIGQIYYLNNERIKHNLGSEEFIQYDKELKEEIDQMEQIINQKYQHQGQIQVMESMKKHWKGLTLFVDNPEIPMDNNLAERMLRSVVVGRKNYWGNHSEWAGNLSVAMFSIIQTCILNNISPRKYLTWYFQQYIKKQKEEKIKIEELLPNKLAQETKTQLVLQPP